VAFALCFALVSPYPALAQDKLVEEAKATCDTYFSKGDAHGLAALYDEKAIILPGNGKTIQGREEIEKVFKSFFDVGVHDHSIDVVHASQIGNLMYETTNWSAVQEEDGRKTQYCVLLKVMTKSVDGKRHTAAHTWNAEENR